MDNASNGVDSSGARSNEGGRAWARDALAAIAIAESGVSQRVLLATDTSSITSAIERALAKANAFGDAVTIDRAENVAPLVLQMRARANEGERTTLIATARACVKAHEELRAIATSRIGTVAHAIVDDGVESALALGDLGWGMLFASGVEDAFDLSLVARRAAEDSGTPFFVVHERHRTQQVEPISLAAKDLCEVFVGAPSARLRRVADPAHPSHTDVSPRAFAERAPFALGSAMRELESLTGRRRDVLERIPVMDCPIMLVGLGEVGESLIAAAERLRAAGHEVGAVKVTALRPFPGARLVKMLSRALAVTIVEAVDAPLAQSNPLATEVKAAFADALTWAPNYPGVGRIPRLIAGTVNGHNHELEARDLDAIVHNMLADERGKRTFVFGADESLALAEAKEVARNANGAFVLRGRTRDAKSAEAAAELCASVVTRVLGLRVRASIRTRKDDDGGAFDLAASRDRPRGTDAPEVVNALMFEDASALIRGNPLARLAENGAVVVPSTQTSGDALWHELPPYAKAIVFDRGARVFGWPADADASGAADEAHVWLAAAAFAGSALAIIATGPRTEREASRPVVDPSLVAREVERAITIALGEAHAEVARRGGEIARRAFTTLVEVPRATVERDEESVRLGRRDARASQRPMSR